MTPTANYRLIKEITHPLRETSLRPPRIIYIRGPLSVTLSVTYVVLDRVPFLLVHLLCLPEAKPPPHPPTGITLTLPL